MRTICRLFAALWLFALVAPAHAKQEPRVAMDVAVVKKGENWTADFTFNQKARAWAFRRSGVTYDSKKPWRPQSWIIETPGVMLERRGQYDVLVTTSGKPVPRKVRVRFAPFARVLLGEYDPAMRFSDGSVALFTEQFSAFPVDDPARLTGQDTIDQSATSRTSMKDNAGPLLYRGQRHDRATMTGNIGSYVIFGPIQPVQTPTLSMIVDPQLPEWIGSTLRRAIPKVMDSYAQSLGPAPGAKPMVMVSWAGPTRTVRSMSGSVLPELVIMTFEGDQLLAESASAQNYALWFIAHEAAHFWLGNLVHEESPTERWIFEGGSDLLAFRSVAAAVPDYDMRGELNRSIAECAMLSAGRGIARAYERNEMRAYYSCGAVFGLVAEAASKKPFDKFIKTLIDANRSDKTISRAEWLAELDRTSGDPGLSRDIGALLDKGSDDPKAAIASLFTRAGVMFTLTSDGLPVLI